jgi:hypothetical protein
VCLCLLPQATLMRNEPLMIRGTTYSVRGESDYSQVVFDFAAFSIVVAMCIRRVRRGKGNERYSSPLLKVFK